MKKVKTTIVYTIENYVTDFPMENLTLEEFKKGFLRDIDEFDEMIRSDLDDTFLAENGLDRSSIEIKREFSEEL